MARKKMPARKDRRVFRRTAAKSKKVNVNPVSELVFVFSIPDDVSAYKLANIRMDANRVKKLFEKQQIDGYWILRSFEDEEDN